MWRIFNGIPRAIRQHFHGPRTAAGICKEEEQFGDQEISQVDNCSWFERTRRAASSPPESRDNGEHTGTDQEHSHWWRNIHYDWFPFSGRHCALEAVTWGAAVVLGIQLSRPRWSDGCIVRPGGVKIVPPRRPSLLCKVAFALPGKSTATQSIEESGKVHQFDTNDKSSSKEDSGFGEILQDFEEICKKYTALGKSVLGLRVAQEGNLDEAVKHLADSSQLGHTSAQFNLAVCLETGNGVEVDLKKAAEYYRKAGEAGHAKALYNLALLHLRGEGGVEKDTPLAMMLLERAAQFGLSEAQTYMGIYYTEEEQQDMKKAVKFFKEAAEQNDPEAQYFLAICYEQGWGVEVNECKAAQLYNKAAQTGHEGALYNLGVFHEHGLGGIPEDHVSALSLYKKSASLGNEHARFKLEEWDAQASLWEWKAEKAESSTSLGENFLQPKASISPSASTPSLTEYVRENLHQLCVGGVRPELPVAVKSDPMFVPPTLVITPPQEKRSKSEQVLFYLRPEDLESHIDDDQDSGYGSPPALTPNASVIGMSRNSSMPSLGSTIECI